MPKRITSLQERSSRPEVLPPSPLELGANTLETIFAPRKRQMSRLELHSALDGVVRAWVAATCVWTDGWSLGDYRFVVFSINVAPETEVYVQLWSEPLEPVYWEVSSGRWNPPADKWLAGERAARISAFGFEVGGRAENFQREIAIQSKTDLADVGRTIVDILFTCFDYRGTSKLDAQICYESRAKLSRVLTSLTPEDLRKVFASQGYTFVDDNRDEDAPVMHVRTRGLLTSVAFDGRIPDQHLFEKATLSCTFPQRIDEASPLFRSNGHSVHNGTTGAEITTALTFGGGVTVAWLAERVSAWTNMIVTSQNEIRRMKRAGLKNPHRVVH
jgi:hypothetical protein